VHVKTGGFLEHLFAICGLSILGAVAASAQSDPAKGHMVFQGKQRVLKYARAANVPNDSGKLELHVLISDMPIPRRALVFNLWQNDLKNRDKLHGVLLVFGQDGPTVYLETQGIQIASRLIADYTGKVVNGKAEGEVNTTLLAGKDFELKAEVAVKFSVPVEAPGPDPAPTAADKETAKTSAVAIQYLAFADANLKGDRAGLKKGSPDEAAAEIDAMPAEELKQMQAISYKNVVVLKAVQEGDFAMLWLSGTSPQGGTQKGEVILDHEHGRWVSYGDNWHRQ
jgi:hypothetical protein